jgi:hypothetical protein
MVRNVHYAEVEIHIILRQTDMVLYKGSKVHFLEIEMTVIQR